LPDLRIFLAVILCTNWSTTICITCPILREIECNEFVCNVFVLDLLQIDKVQSESYKLYHINLQFVLVQVDTIQFVLFRLYYIN
jgi:hypothetical protein